MSCSEEGGGRGGSKGSSGAAPKGKQRKRRQGRRARAAAQGARGRRPSAARPRPLFGPACTHLNLGLHVINGVAGLHLQRDGLACRAGKAGSMLTSIGELGWGRNRQRCASATLPPSFPMLGRAGQGRHQQKCTRAALRLPALQQQQWLTVAGAQAQQLTAAGAAACRSSACRCSSRQSVGEDPLPLAPPLCLPPGINSAHVPLQLSGPPNPTHRSGS